MTPRPSDMFLTWEKQIKDYFQQDNTKPRHNISLDGILDSNMTVQEKCKLLGMRSDMGEPFLGYNFAYFLLGDGQHFRTDPLKNPNVVIPRVRKLLNFLSSIKKDNLDFPKREIHDLLLLQTSHGTPFIFQFLLCFPSYDKFGFSKQLLQCLKLLTDYSNYGYKDFTSLFLTPYSPNKGNILKSLLYISNLTNSDKLHKFLQNMIQVNTSSAKPIFDMLHSIRSRFGDSYLTLIFKDSSSEENCHVVRSMLKLLKKMHAAGVSSNDLCQLFHNLSPRCITQLPKDWREFYSQLIFTDCINNTISDNNCNGAGVLYKDTVFDYIKSLPNERARLAAYYVALDESTALGRLFRVQRGFYKPSLSRGLLSIIKDLRDKLSSSLNMVMTSEEAQGILKNMVIQTPAVNSIFSVTTEQTDAPPSYADAVGVTSNTLGFNAPPVLMYLPYQHMYYYPPVVNSMVSSAPPLPNAPFATNLVTTHDAQLTGAYASEVQPSIASFVYRSTPGPEAIIRPLLTPSDVPKPNTQQPIPPSKLAQHIPANFEIPEQVVADLLGLNKNPSLASNPATLFSVPPKQVEYPDSLYRELERLSIPAPTIENKNPKIIPAVAP